MRLFIYTDRGKLKREDAQNDFFSIEATKTAGINCLNVVTPETARM